MSDSGRGGSSQPINESLEETDSAKFEISQRSQSRDGEKEGV